MKKKDVILIGIVLLIAFLFWLLPRGLGFLAGSEETMLKITVKGELYGTYSMRENQTIEINDTNICEIKDGEVTMLQAECPDHLCLRQGPIHLQKETIVCLPNKVVLEISAKQKDEDQMDSIAQ